MSTRREPKKSSMESIGTRVRQRALTGGEASAVGFTLVVFIFAGAGAGYLLDLYLETSYWIAIGTLLGAVIGFREMFRLTKKLTRDSARGDASEAAARDAQASAGHQPAPAKPAPKPVASEEPTRAKPRIFAVPPPPQASFDAKVHSPAKEIESVESQQELFERLSLDDVDESEQEDGKQ